MAVGDATIGLLFKITSDSSVATRDITNLRGVFTGNLGAIERALVSYVNQAQQATVASSGFAAGAGNATAAVNTFNSALLGTLGLITLGVGALITLAKTSADTGKEVKDLSDKTGVSVRNISILRAAAQDAGVGFGVVSRALDQFVTRLDDAARSSGRTEGALAFKRVGVDAKEGLRDVDTALDTTIKSLLSYKNEANLAADAQRLFGLRNEQAILVIRRLGTSLEDYAKNAGAARLITEEQAIAGQVFEFRLNQLTGTVKGLAFQLGSSLLPTLTAVAELLHEVVGVLSPDGKDAVLDFDSAILKMNKGLGLSEPVTITFIDLIDTVSALFRTLPEFVQVANIAIQDFFRNLSPLASGVGLFAKAFAQFFSGDFKAAAATTDEATKLFAQSFTRTSNAAAIALEQLKKNAAAIRAERAALGLDENRKKTKGIVFNQPGKEGQDREAKAQLEILRIQEQAITRVANAQVNAARRAFEAREITETELERITIEAEQKMLNAKLDVFEAERKEATESKLRETEKAVKLAQIDERELVARQDFNTKLADLGANRVKQELALETQAADEREKQRERELEALERFNDLRIRLNERVRREDLGLGQTKLGGLEQRAKSQPFNVDLQRQIIEQRAELDRTRAALDHDATLRQIKDEEDRAVATAAIAGKSQQEIEAIEAQSNQRRATEARRFFEELRQIRTEQATGERQLDPTSNLSLFGVNDEGLSSLQAFGSAVHDVFAQTAASAGNFKTIVGGALSSVLAASQQVFASFILTGHAGGAAFKRLAADIIASLAVQSAIKAVFELAEGFAAAASFPLNPDGLRQAAMHFTAAKIYGVVAGAAAGVGLGIGAAGGLGGDTSTGQAGGTTVGANATRPTSQTDFRQRLTPEQEAAGIRSRFQDTVFEGTANRLANAVEQLHAKIDSADENAIFIRAANNNYRVVGHNVLRAADEDGGFVRRLSVLQGQG